MHSLESSQVNDEHRTYYQVSNCTTNTKQYVSEFAICLLIKKKDTIVISKRKVSSGMLKTGDAPEPQFEETAQTMNSSTQKPAPNSKAPLKAHESENADRRCDLPWLSKRRNPLAHFPIGSRM